MSNGANGHGWWQATLEWGNHLALAMATALAGVLGWTLRRYRADRAMLLNHDNQLADNRLETIEKDVSDVKTSVTKAKGERGDLLTSQRSQETSLGQVNTQLAVMGNDLAWIKHKMGCEE